MRRRLLREVVVRYRRQETWRLPTEGYRNGRDVYRSFKRLASYPREHMIAILLDNRKRPIGYETVSIGSNRATLAEASCIYQAAIVAGATGVILVHQHPSGLAEPSREDRAVTLRIKAVGELVGIPLLDHVVVGHDGYYSFADAGELKVA